MLKENGFSFPLKQLHPSVDLILIVSLRSWFQTPASRVALLPSLSATTELFLINGNGLEKCGPLPADGEALVKLKTGIWQYYM